MSGLAFIVSHNVFNEFVKPNVASLNLFINIVVFVIDNILAASAPVSLSSVTRRCRSACVSIFVARIRFAISADIFPELTAAAISTADSLDAVAIFHLSAVVSVLYIAACLSNWASRNFSALIALVVATTSFPSMAVLASCNPFNAAYPTATPSIALEKYLQLFIASVMLPTIPFRTESFASPMSFIIILYESARLLTIPFKDAACISCIL